MKRALLSICSSHSLIANAAMIVKETKHFHHSNDSEASRWEETSECTHAYPWRCVTESTSLHHHAILEGKGVGKRNRVERGNVYSSLLIPTIHSEVWHDGDSWNWYFVDSPWWWSWVLANLFITLFSNHYSSSAVNWPASSWQRRRHAYPIEWKWVQSGLFHEAQKRHSLANWTLKHARNACWPTTSRVKWGRSTSHFRYEQALFKTREAAMKVKLSWYNSPIWMRVKECKFSISHRE